MVSIMSEHIWMKSRKHGCWNIFVILMGSNQCLAPREGSKSVSGLHPMVKKFSLWSTTSQLKRNSWFFTNCLFSLVTISPSINNGIHFCLFLFVYSHIGKSKSSQNAVQYVLCRMVTNNNYYLKNNNYHLKSIRSYLKSNRNHLKNIRSYLKNNNYHLNSIKSYLKGTTIT